MNINVNARLPLHHYCRIANLSEDHDSNSGETAAFSALRDENSLDLEARSKYSNFARLTPSSADTSLLSLCLRIARAR